jgi:HAMP domain-containing protein
LIAGAYLTAVPVAVLVAAFGVWWITGKALRPLQDVADAAEQIHAKALGQRLPQPSVHDEVGRLVRVLNDTFDRLERSFAQATRFSSDTSHELKTPLTDRAGARPYRGSKPVQRDAHHQRARIRFPFSIRTSCTERSICILFQTDRIFSAEPTATF